MVEGFPLRSIMIPQLGLDRGLEEEPAGLICDEPTSAISSCRVNGKLALSF